MASLTYAVPRTDKVDSVFPGENWFFYWKSAASLWESKIHALVGNKPIYVPINWAFHDDGRGQIDFGENRADCDLKRIEEICLNTGREVFFLLPLGSFPFLTNGGVPSSIIKYAAQSKRGLLAVCFDRDNKLNKLTSFYDPEIFKSYQFFCSKLSEFFNFNEMRSTVICTESGYFEHGYFRSYFEDYSKGFELGFSRYLKHQMPNSKLEDSVKEEELKEKYQREMLELFYTVSEECFADRLGGKIKVSFLGGCPLEIFKRNQNIENFVEKDMKNFMEVLESGTIPSTILLHKENREQLFQRFLNENMVPAHLHENIEDSRLTDEDDYSFKNLYQFELFGNAKMNEKWYSQGLQTYFEKNYSGLVYHSESLKSLDFYESRLSRVFMVPGEQLDDTGLRRVLKLFLASGRVVIDKSEISENILKKLNRFFLENDLTEKNLFFLSPIVHYELNEGSVTIIDGKNIAELTESKQSQFWHKLIEALNLSHQAIEGYNNILSTWHSRPAMGNELNYTEIRRLGLYNPTSYKSKVKINLRKGFSLLKVLDEQGVKTQKNGNILQFDFAPGGAINVDFGLFELE